MVEAGCEREVDAMTGFLRKAFRSAIGVALIVAGVVGPALIPASAHADGIYFGFGWHPWGHYYRPYGYRPYGFWPYAYYPYPDMYPYSYSYPYVVPSPPVVIQQPPDTVIVPQQPAPQVQAPEPQAQSYYYCTEPKGYYPYVSTCKVPWKPVPVVPPK
jgi:hypothetical protein